MHESVQGIIICENPSTDKDTTISETIISNDMNVTYDTRNTQPQEQNADIHENPSAYDVEMTKTGIPNPMYAVQLIAKTLILLIPVQRAPLFSILQIMIMYNKLLQSDTFTNL